MTSNVILTEITSVFLIPVFSLLLCFTCWNGSVVFRCHSAEVTSDCMCVFSAVCWPMGAVHGAEISSRAENSPVFTDFLLKCHQTLSRTFSRCSSSNLSCHFTSSHSLLTCSPGPTFSTSPAHIPSVTPQLLSLLLRLHLFYLHFTRLTHELCEVVHKFLPVKSTRLQIWWFWKITTTLKNTLLATNRGATGSKTDCPVLH